MKTICLDTETTDFSATADIIQLAIADADTGDVLFDRLLRPSDDFMESRWDEQSNNVNHIYPEDVADCPSIKDSDIHDEVQRILNSSDLVVGHNIMFDIGAMEYAGFRMDSPSYHDTALAFGWWWWTTSGDDRYIDRKGVERSAWMRNARDGFGAEGQFVNRSLSFAAEKLFGVTDFGAHNALNDCNMTIRVWKAMSEKQKEAEARGIATDENGNQVCDVDGVPCLLDENGKPMMAPNEYAFDYVSTYTRDQIMDMKYKPKTKK